MKMIIALLALLWSASLSQGAGLELLVSPQTGDIIVVKPTGSPWGTEETKQFFVLRITEPVINVITNAALKDVLQRLATKLDATGKNGESFPVVTYPFAQYAERTRQVGNAKEPFGDRKQVQQSRRYVNVAVVDPDLKRTLLDPTVNKPVIEADNQFLTNILAVRPNATVEQGELLVNQEEKY